MVYSENDLQREWLTARMAYSENGLQRVWFTASMVYSEYGLHSETAGGSGVAETQMATERGRE
jgi:hypothetical protein